MERDSKKRVREGDEEHNIHSSSRSCPKKHAKTRVDSNYGILDLKSSDSASCSSCCKASTDSRPNLGVFDFPWLKDGIISKSEDWNLEDVFSSPLAVVDNTPIFEDLISEPGQCFYEIHDQRLDFPENKLEPEDLWRPRDLNQDNGLDTTEAADPCIWSFLLNQPLQHPN